MSKNRYDSPSSNTHPASLPQQFRLWDLVIILAVLSTTAFVLNPLFAQYHAHSPACLSNLKQISIAMRMYSEDYERSFPAGGLLSAGAKGHRVLHSWGMGYHDTSSSENKGTVASILSPYIKDPHVLRCPTVDAQRNHNALLPERETYLYNDLAAQRKRAEFSAPAESILVAEGEDEERNVGHAWEPGRSPESALLNERGTCNAGQGATLSQAPTRHNGGASYVFVDGHVTHLTPNLVFFPSRLDNNPSHDGKYPGPDPAGEMTFANRFYRGTFHVR